FLLILMIPLIPLAYSTTEIFMAASPGKMVLGLRIGGATGTAAPPQQLALRWALKYSAQLLTLIIILTHLWSLSILSTLASLAIFVGCFFALGEKKQALHDMIAGTAVFRRAPATQAAFPVIPPP